MTAALFSRTHFSFLRRSHRPLRCSVSISTQQKDLVTDEGLSVTVGLETHVQLKTETKTFCRCPNRFGSPPNHHICPVNIVFHRFQRLVENRFVWDIQERFLFSINAWSISPFLQVVLFVRLDVGRSFRSGIERNDFSRIQVRS